MPVTVGRIPYLSCEPFYFAMERRGIAVRDVVPSAVADAALRGEFVAAPVPLTDCARLQDQFRYLSGFCLIMARKAISVVLHARQPLETLGGARIGLHSDASTAAALLRIVLTQKYQLPPSTYVPLTEPHDACLLIGNDGLRQRHGIPEYPYMYDLGEEWLQWTRLPFVFARWMVRHDLERRQALILEDVLYEGMQDWADGIYRSSPSREDLFMHPRDILEYTQGIRYFIGVPEQRAIERFQQCLAQLTS